MQLPVKDLIIDKEAEELAYSKRLTKIGAMLKKKKFAFSKLGQVIFYESKKNKIKF